VSAVTAIIGVPISVASLVVAHVDTQPPAALSGTRVGIVRPDVDTTILADRYVPMAGTVTGLTGDRLWVLFRSDANNDGLYYLALSDPVADRDGAWQFVSEPVGDNSKKGHYVTFIALQADNSCDEVLSYLPPDDDGRLSLPSIPDGCVDRAERQIFVAP
jgi:hypothetical protein